jgi:Ca-activated chloride channel family protein
MNETHGFLSSKSGPVPLMGVSVEGDILGRGARVKISQRFKNQEKNAVEAVYKFPIPEGAAVCGFSADIDGKKITGHVEEREKAFEMYDDALERGDGGYLLDEERPNIFTLSVGNLNPNAEVMIGIDFVTLLDMTGKSVRFFLPTTISPRYIPGSMRKDEGIPTSDRIHPPYSENVPYGLTISLNIHKGGLLKSIDSPSHPIKILDLKGDPVKIAFSAQSVRMDRDFILNMEYEAHAANRAYQWRNEQETFLQLDLFLESDTHEPGTSQTREGNDAEKEIIFLLDCSGSMRGDSLRQAKKALEICLRGLDSKTAFTIYRFGSEYDCLFKKPEKYSENSLEKGLEYLRNAEADLGGTEILNPLKGIYDACHGRDNIEKNIVLLTDGEVGNEEEIFEIVRNNQKTARMFSIGIGAGCNEYFIKGLARSGRGASELIYPGERIEPKVLSLFCKITQKGLDGISIQWGKAAIDQSPVNPVIFLENPVTLLARCKDNAFLTDKVIVTGSINGRKKEWEISITESDAIHIPVPALWARERIRDLEENRDIPEKRGSRQKERKIDTRKESILELSRKYNILSQATSFVAIEEREEKDKTTGELVFRKIPVPITIGWGGQGSVSGYRPVGSRGMMCCCPPSIEESGIQYQIAMPRSSQVWNRISQESRCEKQFLNFDQAREDTKKEKLFDILSLQQAEGGLMLNKEISREIGMDFDNLMDTAQDIEVNVEVDKFLLLSTAIILQILEMQFSSEFGTWSGIVQKSKDWMAGILLDGKLRLNGIDLMDWAEEFVLTNISIGGKK